MRRTINEIHKLIEEKIENALNHKERIIYTYRVERQRYMIAKDNEERYIIAEREYNKILGEIEAYTDIKILIETSGVLEKPSKDDLIEMLSPREQYVLKEREEGKTYEEIGKEHNITRERVRQIEKKATEKLNRLMEKYGVVEE